MKEEVEEYLKRTSDTFNAIVMVCPLLVIYELCLFFIDANGISGVDFFSIILKKLGTTAVIIFNLIVTGFFIGSIIYMHKKERFKLNYFFGLIVESMVYATVMAGILRLFMKNTGLAFFAEAVQNRDTILTSLTRSLGAGIYEELFFRAFLFGGLFYLLRKTYNMDKGVAFLISCIVSSVLFSVAHFLGFEEPTISAFVFRMLAGVILTAVYYWRSLAVVVYMHTLYDINVFLFARNG